MNVYRDGAFIVIKIPGHSRATYEIAISQCDTNKKMLRWVIQLSSKNWASQKLINDFILVARETFSEGVVEVR